MEDCAKQVDETSKWHLNVEDLWFENKLQHLSKMSKPLILLNPITEKYGFQTENETVLKNGSVEVAIGRNVHKDAPLEPQEVQQQQHQPQVSAGGNEVC